MIILRITNYNNYYGLYEVCVIIFVSNNVSCTCETYYVIKNISLIVYLLYAVQITFSQFIE